MAAFRPTLRRRDPTLWRRTIVGYAFISPVVLGLVIWTFGPMVASAFYFSLTDYKLIKPPEFIGLQNFIDLFTKDRQFLNSLVVTIKYAVLYVIVGQIFALSLAILLTQKVRGIPLFRTLFYLPVVVPFVASALLWRYLFNKDFGPINAFLDWIGIGRRQLAGIDRLGAPIAGDHQRLGRRGVHDHLRGRPPAHPGAPPRGGPDRRRAPTGSSSGT